MKKIIIKLKDNTEIQISKEYIWVSDTANELNDTRTNFINIGDHIFVKATIASVAVEEVEEEEEMKLKMKQMNEAKEIRKENKNND